MTRARRGTRRGDRPSTGAAPAGGAPLGFRADRTAVPAAPPPRRASRRVREGAGARVRHRRRRPRRMGEDRFSNGSVWLEFLRTFRGVPWVWHPTTRTRSRAGGRRAPEARRAPRNAMTEQKEEPKKNVAVDLECDDEFEEFGNEGARRRVPTPFTPPPLPRDLALNAPLARKSRVAPPIAPRPALTPTASAHHRARRVGRGGRRRRGRQPVGGGLGRQRHERRLHPPAPRRARAVRLSAGRARDLHRERET